VTRFVVVASLKPGARDAARLLIENGPPFDPQRTRLTAHEVFVTEREVVFLFEGEDARGTVEELVGDPGVWRAATAWRECLDGRPRLAEETYVWTRPD
jgi:hypothetical protein